MFIVSHPLIVRHAVLKLKNPSPAELSGVFNWVLAGLRRLLKSKKFTASPLVEAALNDYRRESDSVACFLDEAEREPAGLLKDVYADYRAYCSESGIKALGKQKFRKRLEGHGFEVERINAGMRVSRKQE
jgi:putative DNA primase/helicase